MSDELKTAVLIGVECMAFALLILVIAVFGRFSQEALYMKHNQDVTKNDIVEYREMFEFTLGREVQLEKLKELEKKTDFKKLMNNIGISDIEDYGGYTPELIHGKKISGVQVKGLKDSLNREVALENMSGDDVVRFIHKNQGKFDIYVNGLVLYEEFLEKEETYYTVGELSGILSKELTKEVDRKFECIVVYDSVKYEYEAVIFVR